MFIEFDQAPGGSCIQGEQISVVDFHPDSQVDVFMWTDESELRSVW